MANSLLDKTLHMVKIQVPNIKGKAIATKGNKTYIIPSMGYHQGEELLIDLDTAVEMPSFMYAIAVLYKDKTTDAIKFIKENF